MHICDVWAASSSLRCWGPSQVRAHWGSPCSCHLNKWTHQPSCQEFREIIPPHPPPSTLLAVIVILKYLASIKNENPMLFKSQYFSSVYRKCPCGCYFPQMRTIFFRILALPFAGLQAPCLPIPCLRFVFPSRSLVPKWLISYNLLTRALVTKTIRNHFQALFPLTGQTGTFPRISQLTARKALISSDCDECWVVRGESCLVPPMASLYGRGHRASRTPTLQVLVSSTMGKVPLTTTPGSY